MPFILPILISSALSLTAGLLLSGCGSSADKQLIQDLSARNENLHGQLLTSTTIEGILGTVIVVFGAALAVALSRRLRKQGDQPSESESLPPKESPHKLS